MLKYALLGFLNYRPMSGYELKQRMDKSTTYFWHAKLSQVYTTLKTLEAEALVSSSLKEQTERPDKRIYAILPAGRQALSAWLAAPEVELSPKKETVVLKLFFSAQLEKETVLTGLRVQSDLHRRQLQIYQNSTPEEIRLAAEEMPELARDAILWEATRRFGEAYEEIYVRWLEECIQLMETQF